MSTFKFKMTLKSTVPLVHEADGHYVIFLDGRAGKNKNLLEAQAERFSV
jgi:hypothetical protein